MNSNRNGLQKWSLALALAVALSGAWASAGWAQAKRMMGELSAARHASVNGIEAVPGGTVFDRSRVDTGRNGLAILNLGKRGRIEIGGETSMTLGLTANSVGGELRAGSAWLSVPAGVAVSISTEKGTVTSDGRQFAVLQVESIGKDASVTVRQGEASVTWAGRTERVTAGEELSLKPETREWARRRNLYAAGSLATAGALGGIARPSRQKPPRHRPPSAARRLSFRTS